MPSPRFLEAMASATTAERAVTLVTITHAEFGGALRWCSGGAELVSQGRTFLARQMDVAPPGESAEGRPASARLVLDNIEPNAVAALRTIQLGRPKVMLEIVLAETPDEIERRWAGLQIVAARPGLAGIECDLAPRDDGEETWPLQSFSPERTPGLFD